MPMEKGGFNHDVKGEITYVCIRMMNTGESEVRSSKERERDNHIKCVYDLQANGTIGTANAIVRHYK